MKITALVPALFAVSLFAQQQTAPPAVSERVEVSIVNVDVTVLDRGGHPVPNLTKDDFAVFEDGVRQTVTNFSAVKHETASSAEKPSAAAETAIDVDAARRRSVVVLLDQRQGSATGNVVRRRMAIGRIEKLLDRQDGSRWSIVAVSEGSRNLRTLLPFTTDRDSIHATLEALRTGAPLPNPEAAVAIARQMDLGALFDAGDVDCSSGACIRAALAQSPDRAAEAQSKMSFFSAVIQTVRGMAWIPGQKTILLLSADVPGYLPPAEGRKAMVEAKLHAKLVEEANAAQASIYVLDTQGINASFDLQDRVYSEGPEPLSSSPRNTSGAVWLAAETGGLYLPSNRVDQSLEKFDAASTNYYELGYRAAADDGKYHRIDVRVTRPGHFTVTYRAGYLRLSRDDAFERAMVTPFGIGAQRATLPVSFTIGNVVAKDGGVSIVPLHVTIPLERLELFGSERAHVYVSAFDTAGEVVAFRHSIEMFGTRQRNLSIAPDLELKKGTYRIFVTVRDETSGEVGVATAEIGL